MSALALDIHGLRFTYPARRRQPSHEALRSVDLQIPAGQTVALLGPNGSGKSTLMKLICGLLPLQQGSGSINVFGAGDASEIRRHIGVVFQSEGLDRHMTVYENLRDQASLYGVMGREANDVIANDLERDGLLDRRNDLVKTLSKGLARRVDLVRATLHRPKLLLLDEPTVGLDPSARERFLEQLQQRHLDENLTILLSTHLVDEADRQQRVLLMHHGRIVADDTPASLRRRAGVRRITVMDLSWQPPAVQDNLWRRSVAGGGWYLTIEADTAHAQQIIADLYESGVPLSIAPPTLADVFEQMTGTRLASETTASHPAEHAA